MKNYAVLKISTSVESLTYDLLCGITGTSDLSAVKNITLRIRWLNFEICLSNIGTKILTKAGLETNFDVVFAVEHFGKGANNVLTLFEKKAT